MKHILMACGTAGCTSSVIRERVCRFLDAKGFAGSYDFLVSSALILGTLGIPYVNGIPFLTGADTTDSERSLLKLMGQPERYQVPV